MKNTIKNMSKFTHDVIKVSECYNDLLAYVDTCETISLPEKIAIISTLAIHLLKPEHKSDSKLTNIGKLLLVLNDRLAYDELTSIAQVNPEIFLDTVDTYEKIISLDFYKYILQIAILHGLDGVDEVSSNSERINEHVKKFKYVVRHTDSYYQTLYVSTTIELIIKLTRYVIMEKSFLSFIAKEKIKEKNSTDIIFQNISLGINKERIINAIAFEDIYKNIALDISENPMNLWNHIIDLHISNGKNNVDAFLSSIKDSYNAGLYTLPWIDSKMAEIQVKNIIESRDVFILHAILVMIFSGSDSNSEVWKRSYLKVDQSIDLISDNGLTNEVRYCFVKRSMSPYGAFLLDQADILFKFGNESFNNDPFIDGGILSLAYFRVLEVEFNWILWSAFKNSNLKNKIDEAVSIDDFTKKILNTLSNMAASNEFTPMLTLDAIENIFSLDQKKSDLFDFVYKVIYMQLTDKGKATILKKDIKGIIGLDKRAKFRNPPAHVSIVDFKVAIDCKMHVLKSLLDIYGHPATLNFEEGLFVHIKF